MTGIKRPAVVGVDGCRGGWIAIVAIDEGLSAVVVERVADLLAQLPEDALIAIDVPIGLVDCGARQCDQEARRLLGSKRGSSVFPAPIRPVLEAGSYLEACAIRERVEGKRMSQQAYAIIPKIREVDTLLRSSPDARPRIREVHPEVCFWQWNGGQPMAVKKKSKAGQLARETLIHAHWPGVHTSFLGRWPGTQVARDDINDAFAALWTAERIVAGTAVRIPAAPGVDSTGLPMEMWA